MAKRKNADETGGRRAGFMGEGGRRRGTIRSAFSRGQGSGIGTALTSALEYGWKVSNTYAAGQVRRFFRDKSTAMRSESV